MDVMANLGPGEGQEESHEKQGWQRGQDLWINNVSKVKVLQGKVKQVLLLLCHECITETHQGYSFAQDGTAP